MLYLVIYLLALILYIYRERGREREREEFKLKSEALVVYIFSGGSYSTYLQEKGGLIVPRETTRETFFCYVCMYVYMYVMYMNE